MKKIIHYCWFGGNSLPETAQRCIDSWKKYLPGYEIIQWNETNFDINKCKYVKEAYSHKKWAFVSDYARFKILLENGGIYFDTDVEVIKPLNEVISKGSFLGCEKLMINPGLGMGLDFDNNQDGKMIIEEILNFYESIHFENSDGSLNQTTIVEYTTSIFKKYGFKGINSIQKINGISIYPNEYFCPMDPIEKKVIITDKTLTIHHYDASWYGKKEKAIINLSQFLYKKMLLPWWISKRISVLFVNLKYDGLFKTFKRILNKNSKK